MNSTTEGIAIDGTELRLALGFDSMISFGDDMYRDLSPTADRRMADRLQFMSHRGRTSFEHSLDFSQGVARPA